MKGNSYHGTLSLAITKAIIATRVREGESSVYSKELQMLNSEEANESLRVISGKRKWLKLFVRERNDLE